jgi:phage shock protein PspC (stress-responsive transcriptional regulator)
VDEQWSKAELRRRAKRGVFIYGFGSALMGGIAAYFAADATTAILISVALVCATLSALALTLRFADWYSDLMNKPWGRSK